MGVKQHSQTTKEKISLSRRGKNLGNTSGFKKGNISWNKKDKIRKVCLECSKEFFIILSNELKGKGKYCSKNCHNISQIGKPSPRKGIKSSLETIEKLKISKNKNKKIGEKSPLWKGGKPKCVDCNKLLSAYSVKRCKPCADIALSGEKSWRWIKDRTKLKDDHKDRYGQLHRDWSISVKNRDNWSCRIADDKCNGKLESHHILGWSDYPELRYKINNGITLCHAHHPRKRAEEKRLVPTFQELVSVLNV